MRPVTLRGAKRSAKRYAGLALWAVPAIALAASSAAARDQTLAESHAPAAMAATVHALRGCIHSVPASDRRLLTLRFGIGGRPQQTDAAVAARLQTTSAAVATREILAVRQMTLAHRHGDCSAKRPVKASAASSAPAVALSPVGLAGGSRGSGGGGTSPDELLAGAVILAALLVIGHEFRKALFARPPRR
jgi:hypothetical protein